MKVHCLQGRTASGFVTFGGVWEKGEVPATSFQLTAPDGKTLPLQSKPMAFWPDGSIKWSAHTTDAALLKEGAELLPTPKEQPDSGIQIIKGPDACTLDTGVLRLTVPLGENLHCDFLVQDISVSGRKAAHKVYPVFLLERRNETEDVLETRVQKFHGVVQKAVLEEAGPLQATVAFYGENTHGECCSMPFVIRLSVWKVSAEMRFVHTFLFDGVEQRDFLKGMGIRFETELSGAVYTRHVQYLQEDKVFHECPQNLDSRFPHLGPKVCQAQLNGEISAANASEDMKQASQDIPIWRQYHLVQDSNRHYAIFKATHTACCRIRAQEGARAPGVMALTGENGGVMAGIRDFWQKYPGGLAANALDQENAQLSLWFYSPLQEAYDFRHYDTKSHPMTCYEGFEDLRPSAYGIGVTSECRVQFTDSLPSEQQLRQFADRLQKPPVVVADPAYYHEKRAFGYWGLPHPETKAGEQLETALDRAFSFYQREVEARHWYGLFDYGDVMHTYDPMRHCWKYDVGGYAWQNTELVPTYWLWLYFLHTGREDVFSLAEAMSRHASEVDTYHFGPLKGLGSRHNVRHWGCSCKEPRIGMAGHHRFLFYLTGDARLGEVMEDVKDADVSMSQNPHSMEKRPDGVIVPSARSGPDWSSYVSNWMTHYERTLDEAYRRKIETGIRDIAATPYGFASGPDYYYDPETGHLIYHGEIENTPNQHLQICMGGPQIWLETADLLEDDTLKTLLTRLGKFYYLPAEEKTRRTHGQIVNRPFSWPMFATAVSAFSAANTHDAELAKKTWAVLMESVPQNAGTDAFAPHSYVNGFAADGPYQEIPGISTNWVSQWCLNTLMCLEFIPDAMPQDGFIELKSPVSSKK